jgi:putative FmdB family regulatory protein
MPIYEYRCQDGHTFEVLQRFSDDPVSTCQVCGASVRRVFRPVAVHFKGSGFYNTDYGTRKRAREMNEAKEGKEAKADGAKEGKGEGAKESSSSDSTSKSTDAKPAKSEAAGKKPEAKSSAKD